MKKITSVKQNVLAKAVAFSLVFGLGASAVSFVAAAEPTVKEGIMSTGEQSVNNFEDADVTVNPLANGKAIEASNGGSVVVKVTRPGLSSSTGNLMVKGQVVADGGTVNLTGMQRVDVSSKSTSSVATTRVEDGKPVVGLFATNNGSISVNYPSDHSKPEGMSRINDGMIADGEHSSISVGGGMVVVNTPQDNMGQALANSQAILAKNKASIKIDGATNFINGSVQAENGGTIDLKSDGNQSSRISGNLIADGGTITSDMLFTLDKLAKSTSPTGLVDASHGGKVSLTGTTTIQGGILAQDAESKVELTALSQLTGDVSAVNGATVNLSLLDGGTITGNASNAANGAGETNGIINLTMGQASVWQAAGVNAVDSVTGVKGDAVQPVISLNKIVPQDGGPAVYDTLLIGNLNDKLTVDMALKAHVDGDAQTPALLGNTLKVDNGAADNKLTIKANNYRELLDYAQNAQAAKKNTVIDGLMLGDTVKEELKVDDAYLGDVFNNGLSLKKENGQYIIQIADAPEITEVGEVIVDSALVNYGRTMSMLINQDNLDKRPAIAVDGQGRGLWARYSYQHFGDKDSYRVQNNGIDFGIGKQTVKENGTRLQTLGLSFGDANLSFGDEAKGSLHNYSLAAHDTFLGNDGRRFDLSARVGHLRNKFTVDGEDAKASGTYGSTYFTVGGEYTQKKAFNNGLYVDPQVQLQYGYMRGTTYNAGDMTQVRIGSMNSLIGRVGFRLGKEVQDRSNLYFKASLLHEFLGKQSLQAFDNSTSEYTPFSFKRNGHDTWGVVGLGYSHKTAKGATFNIDYEQFVGSGYSRSYEINVGARWNFGR